MDLGLSEAQQMLKSSAREFLEEECPNAYVRAMELNEYGYTSDMWQKLASQGWLGLILPEQYGGSGLNFFDLCILLEEMGRVLLPGPFFSTVVLGGGALLAGGSDIQKREILPRIALGEIIVSLALIEASARWDPRGVQMPARARGNDYVINGSKLFVPNAHISDYLIVATRTGDREKDISLFIVPKDTEGIRQTLLLTVASDKQSEVIFNEVILPASAMLGEVNEGWNIMDKVLQWGAVGKCAEMTGGSQRVLEMTLEYVKQRVQFQRPIGSFQAIQHHCANMATDVEGSRYITSQAAWRLSEGLLAKIEVAMAKAWVSQAYPRVCALAHQCHGAIGFTKDHNLQLYSRRAQASEVAFGDSDMHLETVAQTIGL